MKVLIYGSRGWIGGKFVKIMESHNIDYVIGKSRAEDIIKELDDNKDINVYFYNKNTLIEGTKIGFYPSSVNSTNYLYFNNEYIELLKIHSKDEITEEDINNAQNLYKNVENIS